MEDLVHPVSSLVCVVRRKLPQRPGPRFLRRHAPFDVLLDGEIKV